MHCVAEVQPRCVPKSYPGGGFPFVYVAGALFAFLTFISVMAVYYSKGEEAIVAFVATTYLELVLLVCCLWFYKDAEPGSPLRNRLKASVWTLTTLLTFGFGYMVMGKAGLTLPLALLVWVIAAATGIGAFSAFFEQGSTAGSEGNPLLGEVNGRLFWVFVGVLISILTLNSVMAVYQSKGDGAIVALVATSYVDLLLLFCCLWLYRSSVQGSPHRNRLKASVWTITTLLTFSFAYMVMGTAGLTLPLALLVWAIAAATGIGAFSAFFEQARISPPPDGTMEMQSRV